MGNFIKTQNSFANGEVAPEFYSHDNIHGLSHLQNMDVTSGGGLRRRRGLTHVASLPEYARLVPFSAGADQDYLVVLRDEHLSVYNDSDRICNLISPWPVDALPKLQYAQRFDTIVFVHPDYQPRILRRSGTTFVLEPFEFARNDSDLTRNMPFMRFADSDGVTITVSTNTAGNNYATLTTNKAFWSTSHVGTTIYMLGKHWDIDQYTSDTVVRAHVNGAYTLPSSPVSDWGESAFGTYRGWPCSITFHQDRLVFGGSRDYPAGVWMSQVGRHNNFNVGTGLDDEAIFLTLLSEQRQQICTVVSSDNLQILTSVGEWAISSKPLTPSSVDIKQHTSVGSVATRYLPPQKIEGQTVFISSSLRDIRELSLDELGEKYNATDLCALAKHLMTSPVSVAYNEQTRQLFVVMADGTMAVLNQNSALGISAWGRYVTDGAFQSVAATGGKTYVVVLRSDTYSLERFSDDALDDAGLPFTFRASALPLRASSHNARLLRVRKIGARVLDTKAMFINGQRINLPNSIYADGAPGYSGDVSISQLGTQRDSIFVPWSVHGTDTQPVTVLSITIYGHYVV